MLSVDVSVDRRAVRTTSRCSRPLSAALSFSRSCLQPPFALSLTELHTASQARLTQTHCHSTLHAPLECSISAVLCDLPHLLLCTCPPLYRAAPRPRPRPSSPPLPAAGSAAALDLPHRLHVRSALRRARRSHAQVMWRWCARLGDKASVVRRACDAVCNSVSDSASGGWRQEREKDSCASMSRRGLRERP